jgi:hypothetical protein
MWSSRRASYLAEKRAAPATTSGGTLPRRTEHLRSRAGATRGSRSQTATSRNGLASCNPLLTVSTNCDDLCMVKRLFATGCRVPLPVREELGRLGSQRDRAPRTRRPAELDYDTNS